MSPTPKNEVLETSDKITLKYKKIVKANGINDEVSEVIVKSSGLQGEGFASQTNYVTINFQNTDIKSLHLFTKAHTSNSSHSELLTESKLFEKESRFFMEYVPAAMEFCKTKGCEGLVDMYPKCYYGDDDLIVFENLVVGKGYILLDKQEQQDLDATKIAIKSLAKHHAISHALIQEMGGPEPFFQRFRNLDFEVYNQPTARNLMAPMIDNSIRTNVKILQNDYAASDKDESINFLNSYDGQAYDDILNVIKDSAKEDKFLCLGHGDYWNNNMMFLMEEKTNEFIGHMMIDLQVTRYNSPGLDLGHYLFTSVKPEVRRAHWDEILGHYFDTLMNTAAKLGHPIELTYQELLKTFRRTMQLGFLFGMFNAAGAGFEALKNINMNEIGDLKNFSVLVDQAVQKWMEANPEKAGESVQAILDLVNEYQML
ncbi:unnamed protein product [Orchesella dallaii]|uniref:CHK kinase-like domain-containing protein n=1 Tax=Orchesella dallaii TaxID=48710 RepID=A0ABP1PLP8_9HEXA